MLKINHALRFGTPTLPRRVVAFLFMALMTAAAYAQSPEPAIEAMTAFDNSVQDYALMHRRLERQVGSIEVGTPVAEINRMIHELASAIRAERIEAKQGDLFAPAMARELRGRINDALKANGITANDVRAASRVDRIDYARINLTANDTFPWILGVAMFPCVLDALPPLPPELQYRIVDDSLFLVDVHAGLIVDILPSAIADLTARADPPEEPSNENSTCPRTKQCPQTPLKIP